MNKTAPRNAYGVSAVTKVQRTVAVLLPLSIAHGPAGSIVLGEGSLHGGVHVEVAVEEVVRVIATLDLGEALERRRGIGAPDTLIPVIA
jgi:hypothetical protein